MNYLTAILVMLQRSDLQNYNGRFERFNRKSLGIPRLMYCVLVALRARRVLDNYIENVAPDANLLSKIIQESFTENVTVLDIGCGVAGSHATWMRCQVNQANLVYLLDASRFSLRALLYGYGDDDRYYTSLNAARHFLESTGIDKSQIRLWNRARESNAFPPAEFDLIISFMSLGFHYAVQTYWTEIDRSLKPNCKILLDVRKNADSERFLLHLDNFDSQVLTNDEKSRKFLVTRATNS